MADDTQKSGQYDDSRKLAARARLNRDYVIAETPWFTWVAQRLGLEAGDKILDVGCGPGWFWAEAADRLPQGLALTLVDSSAGMVSEAVARCAALPFASVEGLQADAANLPFDDESFDKVIAMHMLYHVPSPEDAIAQMYRVLKPGGWLAVTTNGLDNKREIHALATVFGGAPCDPSASLFSCDTAEQMMRARFGNVTLTKHPARMRVTNPDDVFLALTSYPPGDSASEAQWTAFRKGIDKAFALGNGALEVRIDTGLLLAHKSQTD